VAPCSGERNNSRQRPRHPLAFRRPTHPPIHDIRTSQGRKRQNRATHSLERRRQFAQARRKHHLKGRSRLVGILEVGGLKVVHHTCELVYDHNHHMGDHHSLKYHLALKMARRHDRHMVYHVVGTGHNRQHNWHHPERYHSSLAVSEHLRRAPTRRSCRDLAGRPRNQTDRRVAGRHQQLTTWAHNARAKPATTQRHTPSR